MSFTAPKRSGVSGSLSRTYVVDAVGPTRSRCISRASVPVGAVGAGQRVHVRLAPKRAAGTWCTGRFSGRLEETIIPVCGFRKLCPEFVAMMTLGTFTFRVEEAASARG